MGPLVENDRKHFVFFYDPAEGSESSQYLRKQINRDIESSGERNRSKHIGSESIFSKTIEFVAKEGKSPVEHESDPMRKVVRILCAKSGEPSSKL